MAENELNPKTLTSGLDDYPRASHPSDDERHVDLRCWMAIAARTMSRVEARVLGLSSKKKNHSASSYAALADRLEDYETLKALHWDPTRRVFADYGLDTPHVVLRNGRRIVETNGSLPELGFVSQHSGYVTMFPLALSLIPVDAPELSDVLDVLSSPDHMWSPHGLRSLASSSPVYGKFNTEHDAPYWRGAIWINMNYLILDALRTTYASHPRAAKVAAELRDNLVATIGGQYAARGFVFENYDDMTGEGRGCVLFLVDQLVPAAHSLAHSLAHSPVDSSVTRSLAGASHLLAGPPSSRSCRRTNIHKPYSQMNPCCKYVQICTNKHP